ncbi:MAG: aldolase/citrate lyase family protein [Rubrivivax sp.]|nr:aldolase/citrate lyase family protein [Rubrivivax sp.]
MTTPPSPRVALFDPEEPAGTPLPVCDHYAGTEALMRKSLALQAELGPVFDITLDGEDGAPVGGEIEHAQLIAELVMSAGNRHGRIGARVLPFSHPKFEEMLDTVIAGAGSRLAYLMVPKPRGVADVQRAARALDEALARAGLPRALPMHSLIETHGALLEVAQIAAHPRIESLSFGLMDFVSAHRGAIPYTAMSAKGQFLHPLVLRAKVEIAAACHAFAKTPSHCVVTEFKDQKALLAAAERACREFGYTRMWSIHPGQVRTIVDAFSPTAAEVDQAIDIVTAAQAAAWAPIRHDDRLHDRASYRYFWQVIERAHRTDPVHGLPAELRLAWFPPGPAHAAE